MAEGIVNLALNKLAEAAVNEALLLYGAGDKLDSLQHELGYIRAFLADAETKKNLNERVKTWVSDVRAVAYRIEDVIDTFIAEVDNRNRPGMINALKRVLENPKKLPIVHKLIGEMDAIRTRLSQIKELTDKYGINRELGDDSSAAPMKRRNEVVLPDEDDPDVIGLEKDKENVVNLLLDPNTTRRRVVSIVGQGGLGKTTLAKKAYNSDKVKGAFEFRLWLSVSQFKLIDLLKVMLEGIRNLNENEKELLQTKDPASQRRTEEHFIKEIRKSLIEKQYLIIMDDVWTEDLWAQIEKAFPDVRNGSRVLVTTRFSEIAKRADSICDPYNLDFLNEEKSQQLLLLKAFPYQDPRQYLDDLSDLPKKFALKCGGLPLALIVVGGLLSRQPPEYNFWNKILQRFNWHDNDDGKKCTEILATSYEYMPAHLKPCFMYFASFPEDYEIKVKPLIFMWVSEALIPEKNGTIMEEIAEDYLNELIQRSLIQVSKRKLNGSIKSCRIHDLLRDLAIEKAEENNFLQIISTQGDQNCSSNTVIRRAALHGNCENVMKHTGPNLRSLLYFGNHMPNVDRLRYLKVLLTPDLAFSCAKISKEMTQLRYLGFYGSSLSDLENERELWKSIGRMRNLQTIYMKNAIWDRSGADCIWNIKTLRHVSLVGKIFGPPSTADLQNLQTLKFVEVRESWLVKGWPNLPSIRALALYNLPPGYEESFHNFLNGLHHLSSLLIFMGCIIIGGTMHKSSYKMLDLSTIPSYNHMHSLVVYGEWDQSTLDIRSFPVHLTKLSLTDSNFNEDPMRVLEKLKSLRRLELYNAYNGKQLSCSDRGFPRLEYLRLSELQSLEEWKVEKGCMPLLKMIHIYLCRQFVSIPELQHMTSLNELTLKGVHPDLTKKLHGDESYKIQHIPIIELES